MAKNTTEDLPTATWTQITDSDVTSITFQNRGPSGIYAKATIDATQPTNFDSAIYYNIGEGEANALLADLWPGISGVRVWVWAVAGNDGNKVMVSHA